MDDSRIITDGQSGIEASILYLWHTKRNGKFTASRIADLLVSGRSKDKVFGETAIKYIHHVACERMIPFGLMPFASSSSIEWGSEHEHEANGTYQTRRFFDEDFISLEYFGKENPEFFTMEGRDYAGCSPDAIETTTNGKRIVEYKCPYNPENHLENKLMTLDEFKVKRKEYYAQMQFNMVCLGIDSGVFVSYDPRFEKSDMQLATLAVPRDDDFCNLILERIDLAEKYINEVIMA